MLKILLIKKFKNTKINNFKTLKIRKKLLRIVRLNIWLIVIQLMEVGYVFYNYLKSIINNYEGFKIWKINYCIGIL